MLTFNEELHQYRHDGQITPSVTQVIQPLYAGELAMIPAAILERKSTIGKAVHLACELYDQGDLDEGSLDPVVRGYFEGWIKFTHENKCEWDGIEELIFHSTHKYAGRLDRRGKINGKKCVADIKTVSVVSRPTAIQLAGYEEGRRVDGDKERVARIAIQLKPDGAYEMHDFTRDDVRRKVGLRAPAINDFAIFLACLTVQRFNG